MARQKKDIQLHRYPARRSERLQQQHTPDAADYGIKELEHELAGQGLYIKDITGDGNCLFRSLSDQLGESNTHDQIRFEVVEYLRAHKDEFSVFIEEDYDTYVDRMGNNGVYGGNVELVAFSRAYQKHLKIYQPGLSYIISPSDDSTGEIVGEMLHIIYHSFEHYSSVRMKDGPHDGKPKIFLKKTDVAPMPVRGDNDPPSDLEKLCLSGIPETNLTEVRQEMRHHKGNVNAVIDSLIKRYSSVNDEGVDHDATLRSLDTNSAVLKPSKPEDVPEAERDRDSSESTPPGARLKAATGKPKISARDKKDMAKRAQKERRRVVKRRTAAAAEKDSGSDSRTKTIHI